MKSKERYKNLIQNFTSPNFYEEHLFVLMYVMIMVWSLGILELWSEALITGLSLTIDLKLVIFM